MEFHVRGGQPLPPLVIIEDAVLALDPASVVDIDPVQGLRVNAAIDADGLLALLNGIGAHVSADDIERQPSVCCGGCSG